MEDDRTALIDHFRQRLVAEAGRSGGWGYYGRRSGRIEPTCWTLIALHALWKPHLGEWTAFARPHLEFLGRTQGADGLLSDTEAALANFTANALAALVVVHEPSSANHLAIDRLLEGLGRAKGVRLQQNDPKQDNQLQGWPWVRDTFSWVEPTAWCLLAMKKAAASRRTSAGARIDEAERLLANRMCPSGGWNYGNASTLGQDLRAYVPTTAAGLLALQDKRADAVTGRSLRWLMDERLSEPSTAALSLATMCLRLYGQSTADMEERLAAEAVKSEAAGNLHAMAMAALALSAEPQSLEAFRVA
jgi:hypothetical protein